MKRKQMCVIVLFLVLIFVLTGCGSKNNENQESSATGNSTKKKIAYVTGTGGLGDKSFNDLGYQAIERLMNQGITCDVAEPSAIAEVEGLLRNFSDTGDYALIIAMGGDMVDPLKKVAADYPDQNFMVLDGFAGMDNIKSVSISQAETGFLVGAFAGLMEMEGDLPNGKMKNIIGVVGGNDIPLIREIITAYECGARYVNPDCTVGSAFVGSWNDPAKGSELTMGLYEQGASIVFQAAGASGMGVIEAAQKQNLYAIGYDGNQNSIAPDNVIGSGVRGLDAIIEETSLDALERDFTGGDFNITMKENSAAAQIALADTNIIISDEITEKIEKIQEFLINSDVEIPTEQDQIEDYLSKVGTFAD